jgi:ribosomal-protein-alanine N-acetyltransferase
LKTNVIIRRPTRADREAVVAAARKSRGLHRNWVFAPTTAQKFDKMIERVSAETHFGSLVIHRTSGALVGVINIGHIIRGPLQSAFIAYYAFADHARQGLMREGMWLVLAHAFNKLKLHRLEANIQPGNLPSLKFIERCEFVREGFSRRYLKIGGRWQDHERWALLAEDWRGRGRQRRTHLPRQRLRLGQP